MVQTVIGIFKDNEAATAAVQNLMDINIGREMIDVALPEKSESRADVTDEKGTLNSKIGRYFVQVFEDADLALKYASLAQRGVTLAVQTENYAEALAAATILDQSGALHVDEESRILEDSITRQNRQFEMPDDKRNAASPLDTAESSATQESENVRDNSSPSLLHYRSRIIQHPSGKVWRMSEEVWTDEDE